MKVYGGGASIPPCILNFVTSWRTVVSCTLQLYYREGRSFCWDNFILQRWHVDVLLIEQFSKIRRSPLI
jgi:hypothetical protein